MRIGQTALFGLIHLGCRQREAVHAVRIEMKFGGNALCGQRADEQQAVLAGDAFVVRRVPDKGGRCGRRDQRFKRLEGLCVRIRAGQIDEAAPVGVSAGGDDRVAQNHQIGPMRGKIGSGREAGRVVPAHAERRGQMTAR